MSSLATRFARIIPLALVGCLTSCGLANQAATGTTTVTGTSTQTATYDATSTATSSGTSSSSGTSTGGGTASGTGVATGPQGGASGLACDAASKCTFAFQGTQRSYLLHVPAAGSAAAGLVVMLHGGGGAVATAADFVRNLTGFDAVANAQEFVVVYPYGTDLGGDGKANWNDGRFGSGGPDDIGFLSALMQALIAEPSLHIDPKRVFLSGFSNGAIMGYTYVCAIGARKLTPIRAFAPVSGAIAQSLIAGCDPGTPLSLLSMHGAADPVVPFEGGNVDGDSKAPVASTPDSVDKIRALDGCTGTPTASTVAKKNPGDGINTLVATQACAQNKTAVTTYTIEGAGHTWSGHDQCPGCTAAFAASFAQFVGPICEDFDATAVIGAFFAAQ